MENTKSAGENNTKAASNGDGLCREDDDLHCQALVWNPIFAVVDSMVLKCAVKLRIFDSIHCIGGGDRAISLPELAASLPVSPDRHSALRRLLRYLAHLRLVDVHRGDSYSLTAASSVYLREGSEKSHAAYVKFFLEEDVLAEMHTLDASLAAAAEEEEEKETFFERMGRDPGANSRFNAGMMCTVAPIIEAVLKGCPEVFEGVSVLVDVGGGVGVASAAIARAVSGIRCVVYDLPHVVEEAPKSDAVEFEAGDMFVSLPPHADAFLFLRVLHVFDDEKALQILKQCKEVIFEEKGKLIIIDEVINEADTKELFRVKLAYDIILMRYTGGQERTEKEWRSLLFKAGFTRCTITRVLALQHIIEARP